MRPETAVEPVRIRPALPDDLAKHRYHCPSGWSLELVRGERLGRLAVLFRGRCESCRHRGPWRTSPARALAAAHLRHVCGEPTGRRL